MNEQQQQLMESLRELIAQIEAQGIDPGLRLVGADGQILWPNVMEVLSSDRFAEFRKLPAVQDALSKSTFFKRASDGAIAAQNIGQLGLAIEQLRRAGNIDVTPPAGVVAQPRSADLQRAVADSFADSRTGLSPAERELARGEIARAAETFRRQATAASGGQASVNQASAQQAALMRSRSVADLARVSAQQRQAAASRLTQQLGLQEQESGRLDRMGQFNFQARELPIWQRRTLERDRLEGAGIANTFGAATAFNDVLGELSQRYGAAMPGVALPNGRLIPSTGDPDVDAVTEASQVAASMNVGMPREFSRRRKIDDGIRYGLNQFQSQAQYPQEAMSGGVPAGRLPLSGYNTGLPNRSSFAPYVNPATSIYTQMELDQDLMNNGY